MLENQPKKPNICTPVCGNKYILIPFSNKTGSGNGNNTLIAKQNSGEVGGIVQVPDILQPSNLYSSVRQSVLGIQRGNPGSEMVNGRRNRSRITHQGASWVTQSYCKHYKMVMD